MDKLNLMKAVLTVYVSAVAAVFLFHPTIKEFIPAQVSGTQVCLESSPVRQEKIMAHYLLIGNNKYELRSLNEKCFELSAGKLNKDVTQAKVLMVREGRSLWATLTKKNEA